MSRPSMAVIRPSAPNLAEMALYAPLLDDYDVTYYYTGIATERAKLDLNALQLQRMRAVRFRSLPDLVPGRLLHRALDFKVGFGSVMLSHLAHAMRHDIINIVDPIYAFAGQVLSRLSPRQKLVVVRWEMIPERYDQVWLAPSRARAVFARADLIICASHAAAASLPATGLSPRPGVPVVPLYPGIYLPPQPEPATPPAGARLAFIGRLQWQKGVHDLLGGLALLRRELDVTLDVIGGGDAAPFRALASRLGLSEAVSFTGPLPNSAVRDCLRAAAVYVQPSVVSRSWCEQFGFAVVEAMAAARPVVAYATGALPEVLGPDGLIVPARDVPALAHAIRTLLTDPAEAARRGRALAARARAQFDAHTQGRALQAHLDRLG